MTTWNSRDLVYLKFRPVSPWPVQPPFLLPTWGVPVVVGFSAWDQAWTNQSTGPVLLISAHISPLPGNSSQSSQLVSLKRRKSLVPTAARAALSTSSRCLWKAKCNRKTLKAEGDFFIFAGPSQNIGSQCSTSSFKVISHADMNVITRSREVP